MISKSCAALLLGFNLAAEERLPLHVRLILVYPPLNLQLCILLDRRVNALEQLLSSHSGGAPNRLHSRSYRD
jgi:hypothetical protein